MKKYHSIFRLEEYDGLCSVRSHYLNSTSILILRSLFLSYIIVAHIINIYYNAWQPLSFVMYFTNLSYYGLTAYFIISFYLSLKFYLYKKQGYIPYENSHWLFKFGYLWLYSTVITLGIIISILYWAILATNDLKYHPNPIYYYLSISFHAVNSIMILSEVLLVCNPIFFIYLPFVLITFLIYLPYALLFHFRYNIWVYFFLNYIDEPAIFAGMVAGSLALCIVIFSIMVAVHHVRDHLARSKLSNKSATDYITQF